MDFEDFDGAGVSDGHLLRDGEVNRVIDSNFWVWLEGCKGDRRPLGMHLSDSLLHFEPNLDLLILG